MVPRAFTPLALSSQDAAVALRAGLAAKRKPVVGLPLRAAIPDAGRTDRAACS
jgi:hypothetical protein